MKVSERNIRDGDNATAVIQRILAGGDPVEIDRRVIVDGMRIIRPAKVHTIAGGTVMMRDPSASRYGMEVRADDCDIDLRVADAGGPRPRTGVILINNGHRNRITVTGGGMQPGGYALLTEGHRADWATYPKLLLSDCPNETKAFRVTGRDNKAKHRMDFGTVDVRSAVFLIDPDPGFVDHVRIDTLRVSGEQENEREVSSNGAKFAYCGLVEIGTVECDMPDLRRHFCLSTQQDVTELRIKLLKTNRPLRVLDGVRTGGAHSLRRLVIDRLVAPTLTPVGGDRPWLRGVSRVGEVTVRHAELATQPPPAGEDGQDAAPDPPAPDGPGGSDG